MDIVSRIKQYMEHLGLSISQFADIALIPRPTLSQILSGRNKKISNELLEKLHAAFPRLNVAWLLFGDGEIENNDIPQISYNNLSQKKQDNTPKQKSQSASSLKPEQTELEFDLNDFTVSINDSDVIPADKAPASASSPAQQFSEPEANADQTESPSPSTPFSLSPDPNKRIQTIMVFYNDNSFEIFTPSQR